MADTLAAIGCSDGAVVAVNMLWLVVVEVGGVVFLAADVLWLLRLQ